LAFTRHVNIAMVAAEAEVGVGTVSRVLNSSPSVRDTTRRRVLEVIARLNYQPSRLATGLSRGVPDTVAILVPYLSRPSVVARLAGAIPVFEERGHDIIVCNVESPEQRDRHLDALLSKHRAAAVIVVSIGLTASRVAEFRRAGLPLALIDVEAPGVASTIIDDVEGGRLATAHLLDLGHRRIGFVGHESDDGIGNRSTKRRLAGYRQVLESSGLEYDPDLVRLGELTARVASDQTAELLSLQAPPTAIFASSDTQAIGAMTTVERLGYRVPDNFSVIGFDDIEPSAWLGLSTVRQPLEGSGQETARRVCALLDGETVRPLRQLLPIEVIHRRSSGPAPNGASREPRLPKSLPRKRTSRSPARVAK
jgi:DNA-binding LacI/PurR family transcriptional regulator